MNLTKEELQLLILGLEARYVQCAATRKKLRGTLSYDLVQDEIDFIFELKGKLESQLETQRKIDLQNTKNIIPRSTL